MYGHHKPHRNRTLVSCKDFQDVLARTNVGFMQSTKSNRALTSEAMRLDPASSPGMGKCWQQRGRRCTSPHLAVEEGLKRRPSMMCCLDTGKLGGR